MQCTEVGFTSFLSNGFSIATAVHCSVADKNGETFYIASSKTVDVLWGQPIKLIQVASNSELHENQ